MRQAVMLILLALVLACESNSLKPEAVHDDRKLFWDFELNHYAVMLSTAAPYDTLRLRVTPRNYLGEPLTGLPAAQYTSQDIAKVGVTSEGVLVAAAPTSQSIWVRVTLTTANLKYRDSVLVKVIAASVPPVLASFSVHPLPPDSAKLAATGRNTDGKPILTLTDTLRARAADASDVRLDTLGGGIPVYFRSSDSVIAHVNRASGMVVGLHPGSVTMYASTTLFGVKKEDVLPYRIGHRFYAEIGIGDPSLGEVPGIFYQPEWKVATGAYIIWFNRRGALGISHSGIAASTSIPEADIVFNEDDLPNIAAAGTEPNTTPYSDHCTGGIINNPIPPPFGLPFTIGPLITDCTHSGNFVIGGGVVESAAPPPYPLVFAIRRFPVPGTYEYRSTMHGTSGRIIVVDESQ